jgi:hypothetical protein
MAKEDLNVLVGVQVLGMRIGYGITLDLATGRYPNQSVVADLKLGVPFRYRIDQSEFVVDPDSPVTAAPLLAIISRWVSKAEMSDVGGLFLALDNGGSIEIQPHGDYEA